MNGYTGGAARLNGLNGHGDPYALESIFGCRGTVVISGGNGCIGLAIARGLAAAGADLISIQLEEDDAVKRIAEEYQRKSAIYVANMTRESEVAGLMARILADGWDPTAFVSCAGIQRRGGILDFESEWLRDLFEVNCTSQFILARDFARHRVNQAKVNPDLKINTPFSGSNGKIIFTASNSSFSGGMNISGYAASKSAIVGMIRSFSNELAPLNIQVNGVAPGFVDTSFTKAIRDNPSFYDQTVARIPAGRWALPEDMVPAAIYLASGASNYSAVPNRPGFL